MNASSQSPYRTAPPRAEPARAPRAGLLRRIKWAATGGARRLRSAQLRRSGKVVDAVLLFARDPARMVCEMIRDYPADADRMQAYRSLARVLSSPGPLMTSYRRMTVAFISSIGLMVRFVRNGAMPQLSKGDG